MKNSVPGKKTHAQLQSIAGRRQPESGAAGIPKRLFLLVPQQFQLLLPLVLGDLLTPFLFQVAHDSLSFV